MSYTQTCNRVDITISVWVQCTKKNHLPKPTPANLAGALRLHISLGLKWFRCANAHNCATPSCEDHIASCMSAMEQCLITLAPHIDTPFWKQLDNTWDPQFDSTNVIDAINDLGDWDTTPY